MPSKEARAVLFDVDGLLVDSECFGTQVFKEVLTHYGVNITGAEARKYFFGRPAKEAYGLVREEKKPDLDVDSILNEFSSTYEEKLPELKELAGVSEFVKKCHDAGYKIAAVSGSTRYEVWYVLRNLGILEYFDVILCNDEIQKGKPDPEGYSLAAEKLGVPIKNCIVFEDAELGIKAAKAAGAYVVGVKIGSRGSQDISGADEKYMTLNDVRDDLLKKFKGKR